MPPSSSSEIVLFVKFIHPQSLPITKVRDCGCGLQAEEGREGGTRRIWIQDVITQLSKPALKVKKKKKFLNQSHSRESSGVDRGT